MPLNALPQQPALDRRDCRQNVRGLDLHTHKNELVLVVYVVQVVDGVDIAEREIEVSLRRRFQLYST